jgi:hypothetical protein
MTTEFTNYFDPRWLKANHKMIHFFGLGFIQLKLTDNVRMHFYNEKLPPITSKEDIHNHRYDFRSQILVGELEQELFTIVDGDDHILEKESCKAGVEVQQEGKLCGIRTHSVHKYVRGSQYKLDHRTFHRVASPFAVSLLTRGVTQQEFADVVRPVGSTKVCPFSKKVDEAELWAIVEEMLLY